MADEGRGEVEYVGLNDDGSAAARRFYERVRNPLLTDIAIEWNGISVSDLTPSRPADLFAAKPLVIVGRYDRAGQGRLRLRGKRGGQEWSREIAVRLPESESRHDVLATLWARTRVEDLMSEDWTGAQHSQMRGDLKESITQLGLQFRLMTQFTSFVAVEESTLTQGGVAVKVEVPVELPHGVSYEGIFGGSVSADAEVNIAFRAKASIGGMIFGSSRRGMPSSAPPPPSPPPFAEPRPEMRRQPQPRETSVGDSVKDAKKEAVASKLDAQLRGLAAGSVVMVKVWLTDDSAAVIARLKQLGLTVTRLAAGKIAYGRVDAGLLAAMVGDEAVLFVSKDIGQP